MEQIVTVKAQNPDGSCQVQWKRESACGGNCAECGGCGDGSARVMEVTAQNPIGARAGDRVILKTETSQILGIVAAVYLIPVILLILGACLWGLWGGLGGLALGFLGAVALDRYRAKEKNITFTITAFADNQ